MDFLENVMSAVGSAAQTVVKKSGEVVEYSKLKYSMFDLSNSIKNLYSQIAFCLAEESAAGKILQIR